MKLHQLFEARQHSLQVEILLDKMAEGPVFFATKYEGKLIFNEIYNVRDKNEVFAFAAGAGRAGRPYVAIEYRAPGYYSFHPDKENRTIGDGWGNGSAPITDTDDSDELKFTRAKIFRQHPPFDVVYTWQPIGKEIEEYSKRMEAAATATHSRK